MIIVDEETKCKYIVVEWRVGLAFFQFLSFCCIGCLWRKYQQKGVFFMVDDIDKKEDVNDGKEVFEEV